MKARFRVALAQILTLPAYASAKVDYLREPAPPDLLPPTGLLAPLRRAQGVAPFVSALSDSHLEDLREKLRAVASFLSSFRPHLVVFPEYSIPAALLSQTRAMAKEMGCTIVAGSHAVLGTNAAFYQAAGLVSLQELIGPATRKAVCPVFFPDGTSVFRFKMSPSKWEPDLVIHDAPQLDLIQVAGDGCSVPVDLRICIDGLSLPGPAQGARVVVVPAWSPVTAPFDPLFGQALLREAAAVIANTALYGGSEISTAGAHAETRSEFLRVPEKDEAVIVADIDVERQFETRGSAATAFPVRTIACAALLYAAVPDHVEAAERLATITQPREGSESIPGIMDMRVPDVLRRVLEALQSTIATGSCTPDDISFGTRHVLVPDTAIPFWNRCGQGLDDAWRMLASLLQQEGYPKAAVQLVAPLDSARKAVGKEAFRLGREPGTLLDAEREKAAPFVNREREQAMLREAFRQKVAVLVDGLPGIGKRTLVRKVAREVSPAARVEEIQVAPGTTPRSLADQISQVLGHSLTGLQALNPDAKRNMEGFVIVRDVDLCVGGAAGIQPLDDLIELLQGTAVRIAFLSSRRTVLPSVTERVDVGRLRDDDFLRLFEYWARVEGVQGELDVARRLHGYPLAAKFAARLLREGRRKGLETVSFIDDVRAEIVGELMRDLPLTQDEQRAIEALSVFRRPIDDELLQTLDVPGIDAGVSALEECFLLEREEGRVFVMPLIREVAEAQWVRKGTAQRQHEVAARYYEGRLKSESTTRRFEYLDEATYHYLALGDFKRARQLGADWIALAMAAREEHWRRRDYPACVAICESILAVRPEDADSLGRLALCRAKTARWDEAKRALEKLSKLGPLPRHVSVGYAEALIAKGLQEEGRAILERVIADYPDEAYARAALGEFYLGRGDPDRAEDLALEAIEIDPKGLRGLELAARVFRNKGELEEAYNYALRAMGISPRRAVGTLKKVVSTIKKANGGVLPPYVKRVP